ncbi:hypothetical protein Trydic_g20676 [Trypoxylus dichotomus]
MENRVFTFGKSGFDREELSSLVYTADTSTFSNDDVEDYQNSIRKRKQEKPKRKGNLLHRVNSLYKKCKKNLSKKYCLLRNPRNTEAEKSPEKRYCEFDKQVSCEEVRYWMKM